MTIIDVRDGIPYLVGSFSKLKISYFLDPESTVIFGSTADPVEWRKD